MSSRMPTSMTAMSHCGGADCPDAYDAPAFWMDRSVTDFYAFTRDSFRLEAISPSAGGEDPGGCLN